MASTDTSPVLRRMLAQTPSGNVSGVSADAKPLAFLVEKLADRTLSLPLTVTSVSKKDWSHEAFFSQFQPPALMLRLRSERGVVGMAGLCPQLRAALIEVQTTGKVSSGQSSDRPATDADAALCSGFIRDLLAHTNAELEPDPRDFWSELFRPEGRVSGARALALEIEDVPLAQVIFQFDLADGAQQGTLQFLIPKAVTPRKTKADAGWKAEMTRAVNDAPVALNAVLHRRLLSLAEVEALQVGDTLLLPRAAASEIVLEASDTSVGPFKLGQISGQKALRRLAEAPVPESPQPPEPLPSDVAEPEAPPESGTIPASTDPD